MNSLCNINKSQIMNKIYRQSFWKASVTLLVLEVSAFFLFFLFYFVFIYELREIVYFSIILTTYLFVILCFISTQYFYVVLTNDSVRIINGILPFIKDEYKYADITKVCIGNTGGFYYAFIQVITPEKKSLRYVIDLVNKKEYANLIKDLKSRGVTVETFNLENYIK